MKKISRRILSVLLACLLTASFFSVNVSAALAQDTIKTWPKGPSDLAAEADLVMDARTGTVLYAVNPEKSEYPASITKLMTALLVLENCKLTDTVTFSREAVSSIDADSSNIAIMAGEQLSVLDCLYALLLQSANDAANGLAEHVAGSMEAFADMMNERAKELGCKNTHFSNPSGLHDKDHYTCAYDMALIMKELIKNETFISICSADKYTIQPTNKQKECRYLAQKHKMMEGGEYAYDGTICGKPGYTPEAGSTLVTYARRDNTELIAVSMNSDNQHYPDTVKLFDYGFTYFSACNMADLVSQSTSSEMSKELFDSSSPLTLGDECWILLPNNASPDDVTSSLSAAEDSSSGILAAITYSYQGIVVGSGTLLSAEAEGDSFDFSAHGTASSTLKTPSANGKFIINIWKLGALILAMIVLFLVLRHRRRNMRYNNLIVRIRNSRRESRRRKRITRKLKNRRSSNPYDDSDY